MAQRDQDAQGQGPIPASRLAEEARQNLDLFNLDVQRVSEVDHFLMKAQQQFEVQHLTQPVGDNAWETHQKVL